MKSRNKIIYLGLTVCFILMCLQFLLQIRYLSCSFPFDYDEGVYWQTIRSLNRGYHLFSDIFYSQLPLFIQITRFFHNVFSESLFGARFAILFMSLPLIPIMYFIGFVTQNHRAGIIAAILTSLNIPIFTGSHVLHGNVPALTFALASLACALILFHHPRIFLGFYLPITASAFLLAISLQLKMIALPSLAVIYLVLFFKLFEETKGKSRKQLLKLVLEMSLIFFLTLGVSSVTILLITGWSFEIGFSQLNAGIFSNFLKNPYLEKINPVELSRRIQEFLTNKGGSGFKSPLEPILCLSLPFFVRNKRPLFIPFVWGLTYVFSFLFYKEFHDHYIVFLEIAYIMMITYSSTYFLHEIQSIPLKIYSIRKTLLLIFVFGVLFTLSFNFYRLIMFNQTLEQLDKRFKVHNLELIQDIQKVIPDGKFILSDTQFLISMADRHVPPWFVDTSFTRIRSGALDCEQLITYAKDIHTAGMLISPYGRFRSLKCKEESLKEIKKIFPHSKEYRSKALLFWKSYE